ncbi:MAG: carbonic anhydrase [Patescibacteria group bacterium]
MSHQCKAIMIHCMDFRLIEPIRKLISDLGLLNDCDVVSVAGGAGALLKRDSVSYIINHIELSQDLHESSRVILINHLDCGAYGGSEAFKSIDEEHQVHVSDLHKAREKLLNKFKNTEVELMLGIIEGGQVSFERVE